MAELEIHHEGQEPDAFGKQIGVMAAVIAIFLAGVTISSGDGLWWRPSRSRNSRTELIENDGQDALLPSRLTAWPGPDQREATPRLELINDPSDR